MLTLNRVNRELKCQGITAKLIKGNGYFYFIGGDVEFCDSTSVLVNSINQLSLDQWIQEAKALKDENTTKQGQK